MSRPLAHVRGYQFDETAAGAGGSPRLTSCRCVRQLGMDCRPGCGACCIAPSISSAIPGMPGGKPAGIPCVQLLPDYRCAIFGKADRPVVCISLRPTEVMCGASREEALAGLRALEWATRPGR